MRPLSAYRVAFTATTFEIGDLLPPGAPDSGECASDNGKIVIAHDSGISLVGSPPEYLRVGLLR